MCTCTHTCRLCVCLPGFIDAQCSVSIDCNFWSDELGAWSSEGVSSTVRDGSVVCSTTHLTTFGGIISIPTSVDELLSELASEFTFNTFSLQEAFDLLSSFSVTDNPTIMSILLTMASLNILTIGCLGWYHTYAYLAGITSYIYMPRLVSPHAYT